MAFLDETGLAEVWACADNVFGRIQRGSYKGSGTYGAANPNSLTFDFVPMVVIVMLGTQVHPTANNGFVYINGMTGGVYSGALQFSLNGRNLSWYTTSNTDAQYNTSGETYHYIAIG